MNLLSSLCVLAIVTKVSWSSSCTRDFNGDDIKQRWIKHIGHSCDGQHLETTTISQGNTTKKCWFQCTSCKECQNFTVARNGECALYANCTLVLWANGNTYSKLYAETPQGSEGITLTAEETAEGFGGTTRIAQGTSESGGAKPAVDGTTEGPVGITLAVEEPTEGSAGTTVAAEETSEGSAGTTLASKGTTERSEGTTLAAAETTEGSEGTKLAVEGAEGPSRTTLAPGGTTEGPRRPTPTTEGSTEVPELDKTITKINKPATEVLIQSTLDTEQTLVTKETTESQVTHSNYENTVNPISPKVTKIPRIVTTSAFTERNSGEKTRRWPKDVPLIKQITVSEDDDKKRAAYLTPSEAPYAPAVGAMPLALALLLPVAVIIMDLPFLVREIRRRMLRNIFHRRR